MYLHSLIVINPVRGVRIVSCCSTSLFQQRAGAVHFALRITINKLAKVINGAERERESCTVCPCVGSCPGSLSHSVLSRLSTLYHSISLRCAPARTLCYYTISADRPFTVRMLLPPNAAAAAAGPIVIFPRGSAGHTHTKTHTGNPKHII